MTPGKKKRPLKDSSRAARGTDRTVATKFWLYLVFRAELGGRVSTCKLPVNSKERLSVCQENGRENSRDENLPLIERDGNVVQLPPSANRHQQTLIVTRVNHFAAKFHKGLGL